MLLGFIIGPMMEEYLRRALLLSHSDPMVFVHAPDQRDHAGHGGGGDGRRHAAGAQKETRGGVSSGKTRDVKKAPGTRGLIWIA